MGFSVHLCQRKSWNKHSSPKSNIYVFPIVHPPLVWRAMRRVFAILGHFRFYWLWALYTQWTFLSIQFTHGSKYMYECRHTFSGARLCWTVAECLGSTYGSYVVTLHTKRRAKHRWQGAWKSQYVKERILIWVWCICSWHARDLRISTQIALLRPESHGNCSKMKA